MKQVSAHFVINCYLGKSLSSTTTADDRISKHRVKYENNSLVWISHLDIVCFPRGTELLGDQPCSCMVGILAFFQFRDEAEFVLSIFTKGIQEIRGILKLYIIYIVVLLFRIEHYISDCRSHSLHVKSSHAFRINDIICLFIYIFSFQLILNNKLHCVYLFFICFLLY